LSNIEIVGQPRAHQIVPIVNTTQNYHKNLTHIIEMLFASKFRCGSDSKAKHEFI
jgi:hypothetical protein